MRAVLRQGVADLDARGDEDGTTAFIFACSKGSVECIGLLAEAGCDKDAVTDSGFTALMAAAFSGEVAAVRAVLDLGVEDLEMPRKDGRTAFLCACGKGSAECIGLLAEAGCDKDAAADDGGTALMGTAHSGVAAAVRAVLDLGVADKEMRNNHGRTAFLFACIYGSAECIGVLAEAGCDKAAMSDIGVTALMEAAHSDDVAAVRAVLALGVEDREAREPETGITAYLIACRKGSVDCMSVLAEAGCDTTATTPAPEGQGFRRWGARGMANLGKDCPPEVFELLDKLECERAARTAKRPCRLPTGTAPAGGARETVLSSLGTSTALPRFSSCSTSSSASGWYTR